MISNGAVDAIESPLKDKSLQFPRQGNVLPPLATERNVALDKFPYHDPFTLKDFGIRAELAPHVRRRSAIAHDRVRGRPQCQSQMGDEAGRTRE
jgi:hypothetical protein